MFYATVKIKIKNYINIVSHKTDSTYFLIITVEKEVILFNSNTPCSNQNNSSDSNTGLKKGIRLTLRLLISYIYGAPSKARNANVVYIWTYVWQR